MTEDKSKLIRNNSYTAAGVNLIRSRLPFPRPLTGKLFYFARCIGFRTKEETFRSLSKMKYHRAINQTGSENVFP